MFDGNGATLVAAATPRLQQSIARFVVRGILGD